MKRYVYSIVILFLLVVGCSHSKEEVKGEIDIGGKIIEIDARSNRVLIEDNKSLKIWVLLPEHIDISKYSIGDEVVVWTKTIQESNPAQTKALNIEKLVSNE
ncbi:hypothetical protein J6TS2_25660 [Heyndrickxia sporothermodurans]|nr:hypothetical protein J6TS2_25660 [Heyndrickxia sporothermodurans]